MESEIKNTKTSRLPNTNETETTKKTMTCLICYGEMEEICVTPCGHLFCHECITEWLKTSERCPICNSALQKTQLIKLKAVTKKNEEDEEEEEKKKEKEMLDEEIEQQKKDFEMKRSIFIAVMFPIVLMLILWMLVYYAV